MKLKGYSRPTRYKLGLCASIHLASTIDSFVDNKIDLPWRNFLSSEVRVKFQREVPLFLGRQLAAAEYTSNTYRSKEAPMPKTELNSFIRFHRTPTCDRRTKRDRGTQVHDIGYHASIASRGNQAYRLFIDFVKYIYASKPQKS